MKPAAFALPLLLSLVSSAGAQQAASAAPRSEMEQARAAKLLELQQEDINAAVHRQYAAEAPKREAQRRWTESHRPWRLLIFRPQRPGDLSLCENAHLRPEFKDRSLVDPADPAKARWLLESASIRWSGGRFAQAGAEGPQAAPRRLSDACFTLFVDGAPVISGALLPAHSARRFDYPALLVEGVPPSNPLKLKLVARFPDQPAGFVPADWQELLKGLASSE